MLNHLQTKQYQELLNLVLKSEGRTIEDELGLGCLIKRKSDKVICLVTRKSGVENQLLEYLHPSLDEPARLLSHEYEILGRPLMEGRILMALRKVLYDYIFFDSENNQILIGDRGDCNCSCNIEMITHHKINWKLGKPAHLQSLETIEKLVEVLK